MDELHRHLVLLFLLCCRCEVFEEVNTTHEIGIVHGQILEAEALTTAQDRRELTRGQLDDLGDLDDSTYREEVAETRILDVSITLRDDTEAAIPYLGLSYDLHRLPAAHEDGHHRAWEDGHIAQGDEGELLRLFLGLQCEGLILLVGTQYRQGQCLQFFG